jgi:hypothetical protein
MTAHDKAAQGVSSTPAASENHYISIVASAAINDKTYTTLQAKFALLGHALTHSLRCEDGRSTYTVERWDKAHYFTHLHDVTGFLTQIGGSNA